MNYSDFINKLLKSDIKLNRAMLSELAFNEPLSFKAIVEVARQDASAK